MPSETRKERVDLSVSLSIPSLFTCHIYLELMTDLVILLIGISYDQDSIENWFDDGNNDVQ